MQERFIYKCNNASYSLAAPTFATHNAIFSFNTMLLLHNPTCSTCRKAIQWLEQNRLIFEKRHIANHPPTIEELSVWIERSGVSVQKFFNTSGVVYKERGLRNIVKEASPEELIALLAEDGKLVKRPLLVTSDIVLVGFKEDVWSAALLSRH